MGNVTYRDLLRCVTELRVFAYVFVCATVCAYVFVCATVCAYVFVCASMCVYGRERETSWRVTTRMVVPGDI